MKIPSNAEIPGEKLTHYLLVYRMRNDKAGFLALAGFTLRNANVLEDAIRRQISDNEAIYDRQNEYGAFYEVAGKLHGPQGALDVITIWLKPTGRDSYRFVTLKPAR